MSKASKWKEAWLTLTFFRNGFSREHSIPDAEVTNSGDLNIRTGWPFKPSEALGLARWIQETFGEGIENDSKENNKAPHKQFPSAGETKALTTEARRGRIVSQIEGARDSGSPNTAFPKARLKGFEEELEDLGYSIRPSSSGEHLIVGWN